MFKHRSKLSAGVLVILAGAASHPVAADKISDIAGEIAIVDTAIEPAARGSYTDVVFRLENKSSTKIRMTRVETKLGERGAFDVHAGSGSIHSDGFSLGAGEWATFNKDNLRLKLGPLDRELKEGEVVELTFTFDRWSTVVPVHVHAAPQSAKD
ncbi:copper chaperone PCu(A)C [Microvirga sp. Mcv34]|uniref:copper chaperone PCu(A)C n=1 Tax=Microvirga sp. Mcv34 TaxID=2926016 RepID=UPI0021C78AFD|nr:copper chaperone PCu(A)C [Microvirga sp. Mcv34]